LAHTRTHLKHTPVAVFLLLFAVCAIFIYMKFQKSKEEQVLVVYTAVFEVDAAVADLFHVGEQLIDARGKESAGEILRVTKEETIREDVFGTYLLPHRVTLALTLLGEGTRKEGDVRIGTLTPRVGEAIYLLGTASLGGLCVKVRCL